MARTSRGGAQPKVPGGLGKVLFVRASSDLLKALDDLVRDQKAARPGVALSRSDAARELLYEGLRNRAGVDASTRRSAPRRKP